MLASSAPEIRASAEEGASYLGSGSLPMEALPTIQLAVSHAHLSADELARRLRQDDACVVARIERERVVMDLRTIFPAELSQVAAALGRASNA